MWGVGQVTARGPFQTQLLHEWGSEKCFEFSEAPFPNKPASHLFPNAKLHHTPSRPFLCILTTVEELKAVLGWEKQIQISQVSDTGPAEEPRSRNTQTNAITLLKAAPSQLQSQAQLSAAGACAPCPLRFALPTARRKSQPEPMMGDRCGATPNILLCLTHCLPHHHLNWFQHHPRCWWGAKQMKRSQISLCQLEEVSFGVQQQAQLKRAPSVRSSARSSKYLFTTQESLGPWIYPWCYITLPTNVTEVDRNVQVEQEIAWTGANTSHTNWVRKPMSIHPVCCIPGLNSSPIYLLCCIRANMKVCSGHQSQKCN